MGWTFRRRIKLGPINLNFSRSGMGMSAGAGPFRTGVDAKGRHYTNVRGPFGLYNRQYTPAAGSVQPQTAQTLNSALAKDSLVPLLFSVVASMVYFSGGVSPETQGWWILFILVTGIPAVLGLIGYFANKDASNGWFQIIATIVKGEKWLLVGIFLLALILVAASGGNKRRK